MFDISNELSTTESSEMVTLFFGLNSVTTEYKSGVEDEQKKSFRNHLLKEIDTLNKELDDIRVSYSEGNSETSDDPKS